MGLTPVGIKTVGNPSLACYAEPSGGTRRPSGLRTGFWR